MLLGYQDLATFSQKKGNGQESASSEASEDSRQVSKSSSPPRRILTRRWNRSSASVTVNAEDGDGMVQDSSASGQSIESSDDEMMNAPNVVEKKIRNPKDSRKCETCGKSPASKQGLVVHFRTHTGEKPYECDLCPQRFTQRSALTDHRRTHFAPSLKCDICKKKFIQSSALRRHRLRHLPWTYRCKFCPMKFATSDDLRYHRDGRKGNNLPCKEQRRQLAKK